MAKILSITNQKGGVGKTTTAITLGVCIANMGHKVLLIDLDPSSSLSIQMNYGKDIQVESLYTILTKKNIPIEKNVITSHTKNLSLLYSDTKMNQLEQSLFAGKKVRGSLLKKKLESLLPLYNYIIIDTAPTFGSLLMNSLVASDLILVPIQTEFSVFHGLNLILDTIAMVEKSTKTEKFYRFFINMYDPNIPTGKKARNLIREKLFNYLLHTEITYSIDYKEANNLGKSVIEHLPYSKASQEYSMLAKEVIDLVS